MSSKKKKRYAEYLKRQEKRDIEKRKREQQQKAMDSGDIEEMAKAFGIRLS